MTESHANSPLRSTWSWDFDKTGHTALWLPIINLLSGQVTFQKQTKNQPHSLTSLKANSMILGAALHFIMTTGGCGPTSCFCIEPSTGISKLVPFNKQFKGCTTCNDRYQPGNNIPRCSVFATCIHGNRASASRRKCTLLTYLHENWSLATDMGLILVRLLLVHYSNLKEHCSLLLKLLHVCKLCNIWLQWQVIAISTNVEIPDKKSTK